MSDTWVRVSAGIVAFAIVTVVGVVGLFGFAPEVAATSWAVVSALGVVAGIGAYAAVEYAQTRRLDSLARQFDTRTVVLMPVAIALNIGVGMAVASAVKVPLWLDSIGTILVAALAGPFAGAVTGFASNLIWTYAAPPPFQSPTAAPFAIVAVVVGLLAGSFARFGFLRPRPGRGGIQLALGAVVTIGLVGLAALAGLGVAGFGSMVWQPTSDEPAFVVLGWVAVVLVVGTAVGLVWVLFGRRDLTAAYVVVAGVATGLVTAMIAAPIAANLFGGVTGGGPDLLVALLRQGGADVSTAVLGQAVIFDPIDKVVTYFLVYLVIGALSVRTVARFPQGEALLPEDDRLDPAGRALGATR